ncbi:hypothetical protein T4A_7378 [Trichinella pseudospiralis]|uniref:Uncharacterized protein n=1 Tax=Trichinella pseudospiralis TaxID=6337 RepID=A0A0V1E962_TRIPS|nr:hypothetical protein T4A_7378 [Trichinella pseudospiralis]
MKLKWIKTMLSHTSSINSIISFSIFTSSVSSSCPVHGRIGMPLIWLPEAEMTAVCHQSGQFFLNPPRFLQGPLPTYHEH